MNDDYDDDPQQRFNFPEVFHGLAFLCILANLLLSPWCFGSWESWWFWPLSTLLFAACFFSGVACLVGSKESSSSYRGPNNGHFIINGKIFAVAIAALPFLLYTLARAQHPSAADRPLVSMEMERSLLLFFTPAMIATVMFLSLTHKRLKILLAAFLLNSILLAVYAIANHLLCNSDYVLWVVSPWGYGDRAKGPFFCPNHLSAYLNLGIAFCLALFFAPKTKWLIKIAGLSAAILLAGANFLSLSRGGLASLLLGLVIGLPTLALRGHRLAVRVIAPLFLLGALALAFMVITQTSNPLRSRVESHPLYRTAVQNAGSPEWRQKMHDSFWYSFDRGTYIQSALRAWKSNPVWGIGPGQHSNRWAEFAATDDAVRPINGDLSTLKRPRYVNNSQHLYEVHSDWTQLLEEYGVVGLVLFLISMTVVLVVTGISQSQMNDAPEQDEQTESDIEDTLEEEVSPKNTEVVRHRSTHRRHRHAQASTPSENRSPLERALPLASLLACLIMTLHSLGDFSFQIPAITWAFAVLVTGGILAAPRSRET